LHHGHHGVVVAQATKFLLTWSETILRDNIKVTTAKSPKYDSNVDEEAKDLGALLGERVADDLRRGPRGDEVEPRDALAYMSR